MFALNFFVPVAILAFAGHAIAYDCESFTVSSCDHSSKKYDGPPGLPEEACQDFCEIYDDVKFFRYKSANGSNICECYAEDYRQDCAFVGGNQDTPADKCLSKANIPHDSCDLFLQEDCEYTEAVVFEAAPGSIADASHCQELCELFEISLNCHYWTFQSSQYTPDQSTHCTLYEGFNAGTCTSVLGPEEPHHKDCL